MSEGEVRALWGEPSRSVPGQLSYETGHTVFLEDGRVRALRPLAAWEQVWKVSPPAPMKTADEVDVAKSLPYARYNVVGVIYTPGVSAYVDPSAMLRSMREAAGQLGANALILDDLRDPCLSTKAHAVYVYGPEEETPPAEDLNQLFEAFDVGPVVPSPASSSGCESVAPT